MTGICDMKKAMKASALKTVIVKCSKFWEDEFEIDSNVFEDIYMEASTRGVEKRKDLEGFKVTVMIECWEKKDTDDPNKHFCYNTYFILINAGLHKKAEILRKNFINMHNIDLQKESLKPHDDDGGNKNKFKLD